MKKIVLALFFISSYVQAYDFGLLLYQNAGPEGDGSNFALDYSAVLVPRFSTSLGNSGDILISAGVTVNYEDEKWSYIPELLRTEITGRIGSLRMKAGRIQYADPLNYVMEGLFDGAQFLFDTAVGTFSAGAWYTGLLYKNKATITITQAELDSYDAAVDYNDFFNTYFAPPRILAALGWEHPAVGELVHIKFALAGQFDLNDENPYHSQYALLKASIPVKRFVFELGGCFQTAQAVEAVDTKDQFSVGFAGELGLSWAPLAPFQSQLSLNARYSSGRAENGSIAAFVPVTTKYQGNILEAKLSGISAFNLDYTARLHRTFSSSLTASYFIRNDLETYMNYPMNGSEDSDGYCLGGELYGRFIWNLVSDLRLNLGGGVFLPSLGNTAPDTEPRWSVELGIVLALR